MPGELEIYPCIVKPIVNEPAIILLLTSKRQFYSCAVHLWNECADFFCWTKFSLFYHACIAIIIIVHFVLMLFTKLYWKYYASMSKSMFGMNTYIYEMPLIKKKSSPLSYTPVYWVSFFFIFFEFHAKIALQLRWNYLQFHQITKS